MEIRQLLFFFRGFFDDIAYSQLREARFLLRQRIISIISRAANSVTSSVRIQIQQLQLAQVVSAVLGDTVEYAGTFFIESGTGNNMRAYVLK